MASNQQEQKVKLSRIKDTSIAKISIQNPPMNQLSGEVLMSMASFLDKVKEDERTKAVLIEGSGLFSAGANVNEIWEIAKEGNTEKALELLVKANAVVDAVQNLGKPTIAAINSYCLGGGNELAMACTCRIATEDAKFGQPEINLGIIPGMGGTQRLPRLIDLEMALRLLLSGMIISAADALKYGLVDRVVPKAEIDSEAKMFALQLIMDYPQRKQQVFDAERFNALIVSDSFKMLMQSKSSEAVVAILSAVKEGMTLPLDEALKLEQKLFSALVVKDSAKRGLAKFLKIDLEPKKPEKPEVKTNSSEHEEDLKMFREMVREFAEKEICPRAKEMEEAGRMPRELFNQMGEMGFYAASYPEEYGGGGLGKVAYCIMFEELSRAYGSAAVVTGAHTGLACGAIFLGGNEAQKQKYLCAGIEGKMMGAFALTEPTAGSDAGNIKTSAVKKDGGWVLNGSKRFITNGKDADFTIVIAQTDPFLKKDGLTAFIVETKWPGYKVSRVEHKIGIKGSQTVELALEDLFVPDENLLGEVGGAFKMFMKTLNGGRLGLAAGCVGSSKRVLELAFKHASERRQFDQPIIMNEVIQFDLARMRANIYFMEQATHSAAKMADEGKDIRLAAATVKLLCSELNMWNADRGLQIHGGDGYSDESEIGRIWRDSRINPIFEGTNEIQQLLIFKEIYNSGGKI
ncbi:MAG: acyl-CoA dehydrogenase family protein [Candidatus Yanofskybacteria bacterium]|nr:acyl-CoA dehydrogenase family protein [Candidatus Yanofskybacteria bacterium]